MSGVALPDQVTKLAQHEQDAIKKVLIDTGLMAHSGELGDLGLQTFPHQTRAALQGPSGQDFNLDNIFGGINVKCIAARIAEAAAVTACASVPGGQIVVAACVVAAHKLADEACK